MEKICSRSRKGSSPVLPGVLCGKLRVCPRPWLRSAGLCGERPNLHFPVMANSSFLTACEKKILFLFASFLLINFVSGVAGFLLDYFFSDYFLTSG